MLVFFVLFFFLVIVDCPPGFQTNRVSAFFVRPTGTISPPVRYYTNFTIVERPVLDPDIPFTNTRRARRFRVARCPLSATDRSGRAFELPGGT